MVDDSRRFLGDFGPADYLPSRSGDADNESSVQRYDEILSLNKTALTKSASRDLRDQTCSAFTSIVIDNPEETWNKKREQELVERLAARKERETSPRPRIEGIEECTYQPRISQYLYDGPESRSVEDMPKAYQESVDRIRKVAEERKRKLEEKKIEHKLIDQRLKRLQRMKPCPPKCYYYREENKATAAPDRRILMYVDIAILPGKYGSNIISAGRVGKIPVAEGDDLSVLASNFARTYGLNAEMRGRVLRILGDSVERYQRDLRPEDEARSVD